MDLSEIWSTVFSFEDYAEILPLVSNSLIAGALLGLVGGMIGIFVMLRDMAFAVHGIAELSFAGAAFALLIGTNVVVGSLVGSVLASLLLGIMGAAAKDRNSIIGVLMPFGLGLGILFLALYQGRSANKFGLLTGQIVAVDTVQLGVLAVCSVIVMVALVAMWRPLTFISVDPAVAAARGIPAARLSVAFMVVLGLAVALSIQVVGALLVLALLITPAAAAIRVTSNPVLTVSLSVAFAMTSVVGGILLALAGSLPISPYVTTISFLIYLVCRLIAWRRHRVRHSEKMAAVAA
ncbi:MULTISPECIES: metal ABC transporter permease [Paeniglutamicibacter]|jgi:zinc/manganese transport system permease protein|uniref:Zinc/manganese transport system permease protein n=1 Tax=Paeniglutamicibacter sulfureus TaxID=43666 RepID=A0ABU2BQ86_9MICC|nr:MULTISPECIES: metal ABC transporter permease [Paeniglutamicibacter]MCV9993908.1 metal ABC transporter permease [Paeniglutamicibacter sp. ZC-3]MDO2935775.1 metal ABC transporter permease [Paeniglutamicibacter sulfureus]MDR7360164.1 zinc/manganese transport system permease protein [Paeniglutamicibacter sulfureus]